MENKDVKDFISYVKTIVSIASAAITIIVGTALIVSYSNLQSLRDEVNREAKEMKQDVKEIREASFNEVQATRKYAKDQIDAIKSNAESVAIITSNRKIEEKFASTNLDYLIESTAKKEVESKLDVLVDNEVKSITEMLVIIPELTRAYEQIRFGSREDLDYLDSMSNFHASIEIREIAQRYLFQKGIDYTENVRSMALNGRKVNNNVDPYQICGGKPKTPEEKEAAINSLVDIIFNSDNLGGVGKAFVALNLVSGKDFKAFDITGVKNWYFGRYR